MKIIALVVLGGLILAGIVWLLSVITDAWSR